MYTSQKNDKKKNILIILNNNLTAICMLAYYIQNRRKYQNARIKLIIDKTYNKSFLKRYNTNFIKKTIKILDPLYEDCGEVKIPKTYNFNFKNLNFFLKKINYLRNKNKQFIKKKIIINNFYREIWTGNSELINFFDNNTKIIKFEHGLSEISQYIKEKKNHINFFIKLKRVLENFISNYFFFKKNYFFEFKLISLFSNLLSFKIKNVSKLKIKNYFKSIKFVIKNINLKKKYVGKNILINYPLADFSNKRLVKNFNNEFSNFIFLKLKHFKIDKKYTLIIKKKPSHSKKNLINLINQMKESNIRNNIVMFESIYKFDFIIDLFIENLRPKILFSNLNSSTILFKYLFPKNTIIETDKFVINFLEKNFNDLRKKKINEISRFNEYKKNLYYFIS